jgi:plastocyanin
VKGVTALVSGYVFLATLAAPAALFAAGGDPRTVGAAASSEQLGGQPQLGGAPPAAPTAPPAAPATPEPVEAVSPPAKQAAHEVVMRNIEFVPREITVNVGDTITWRNEDSEPHNAIANDNSFHTNTFGQGETASVTIDQPGEHRYFCSIHAGMTGTVTTQGAGPGGGGGGTGGGGSGTGGGGGGSGGSSGGGGAVGGSDVLGDSSGTGATSSGTRGGTSSLPSTGQDSLWFAFAGAWLLSVGAVIRAAFPGAERRAR